MSDTEVLITTDLPNLHARGKVRDTYRLTDTCLLMIATDRISAFDVVLPTGIPGKGEVLTRLSAFWFDRTSHLVPNHMLGMVTDVQQMDDYCEGGACPFFPPYVEKRSLLVRRADPLPVECVVRGYLSGSAWIEYRDQGTINSVRAVPGLRESDALPSIVFTPTTKAAVGHDLPVGRAELVRLVRSESLADELETLSIALYRYARDYALTRGIILADTKFEFGYAGGQLILIDEALTPDSSRFWPLDGYEPGGAQPSYDKQYVRDWLRATGWNREPPAPHLPPEVVVQTAQRYREALRRLTGQDGE